MTLPRNKYVHEGQEGVYHCFTRCVRRAFLYGLDPLTRRDFSHRKAWLVNRLKDLSAIFAIDVCAYAIMENHYHTILRTRPDIAACWSDREVAIRWLTLFPKPPRMGSVTPLPTEDAISDLLRCPERIAALRKRLCNLSWFMGRLNEFIARAANKEDRVKGRFWESRFKCQALLDEAAISACMVYVDLNPIRAGSAATPEQSDFTSIQERIRSWQNETMAHVHVPSTLTNEIDPGSLPSHVPGRENAGDISQSISQSASTQDGPPPIPLSWLCPIAAEPHRRGILRMMAAEYFSLVDKSGREIRSGKQGAISPDLAPILLRIGLNEKAWIDTISHFESKFYLASGLLPNLRSFAQQIGNRWLKGVAVARIAFASSPS
jgi:REP element-mobilizing transposase RayT